MVILSGKEDWGPGRQGQDKGGTSEGSLHIFKSSKRFCETVIKCSKFCCYDRFFPFFLINLNRFECGQEFDCLSCQLVTVTNLLKCQFAQCHKSRRSAHTKIHQSTLKIFKLIQGDFFNWASPEFAVGQ